MESENVSTSESQVTVLVTTTGSFQNHTSASTATAASSVSRKRDIVALLDITNMSDESRSREAGEEAKRALQAQTSHFGPRGNPVQGAMKKRRTAEHTSAEQESVSLLQLMGDETVSSNISETLLVYTQRNVSHEIQKAIAITITETAVTKWNCSIVEAANRAADCSGFNAEIVRRWTSEFCSITSTCPVDDMSDECITDILSSGRGHHDNHAASLLYNEIFCLSAREYVRKHACGKGEPNLTSKMFADWIHREYDTKIQDRTARRWLAKLGFSQVQHQKGVYFDGHERADVVACRDAFLNKNGGVGQKFAHSQWQYSRTLSRREASDSCGP